jgi:hypothetical protein
MKARLCQLKSHQEIGQKGPTNDRWEGRIKYHQTGEGSCGEHDLGTKSMHL